MESSMTSSMSEKYSTLPARPGSSTLPRNKRPTVSKSAPSSGAVDEVAFLQSFEQVPTLQIFCAKDVSENTVKALAMIKSKDEDWDKKIDGLRLVRSLVMAGSDQYDEFMQFIRASEVPFQGCLADLRSQVVRETCVTIGYLAEKLSIRLEHFCESIIPSLFNLVPNSAKVMASCSCLSLKFIILNVQSPKLLPHFLGVFSSKSNITRRAGSEFLELICCQWSTKSLEKHSSLMQEAIKRQISDADQVARAAARKAFCSFAMHFPQSAKQLLSSVDSSKRRALETEMIGKTGLETLISNQAEVSNNTGSLPRRMVKSSSGMFKKPTGPNSNAESYKPDTYRSRTQTKKPVSYSQPASRETSPAARHLELLPTQRSTTSYRALPSSTRTVSGGRLSGGTKSQVTSREASPVRNRSDSMSDLSKGRRNSVSRIPGQRRPSNSGLTLADIMSRDHRRFDRHDSEDNMSETSSIASECSSKSSGYNVTENISEIMSQLNGSQWTERKSGLLNLSNYLQMFPPQPLNSQEIIQITQIFSKYFHVSQSKLVMLFLETLQIFLREYNAYLHDWLHTVLSNLLLKQSNEVLSSNQKRIMDALQVVKSHFPIEIQFQLCCKLIVEASQTPNLKYKVALLNYVKELILLISPSALEKPNNDLKTAFSRIISWALEPKSIEVRKTAGRLLSQLFQLNEQSCTLIVDSLPRQFQESAYKTLNNQVDRNYSKTYGSLPRERKNKSAQKSEYVAEPITTSTYEPGDLDSFIRQATADIQSLSIGYDSQYTDLPTSPASLNSSKDGKPVILSPKPTLTSSPFSQQSDRSPARHISTQRLGSLSNLQKPIPQRHRSGSTQLNNEFSPKSGDEDPMSRSSKLTRYSLENSKLSDSFNSNSTPRPEKPLITTDTLEDALNDFNSDTNREETRAARMLRLLRAIRDKNNCNWEKHFRTTLLLLLEMMGDPSSEIRALSLRVLQELISAQPDRLNEYVHLTLVKIIEAHNDDDRMVVRAAEECSQVVADQLSSEVTLGVLEPIVIDTDSAAALPALKVQTKIMHVCPEDVVRRHLHSLIKGLVQGCGHNNSHIRKNSIFCLVEVYFKIGEELWEYLDDLHSSKIRLLKLYIERSKDNKPTASTGSQPTSALQLGLTS